MPEEIPQPTEATEQPEEPGAPAELRLPDTARQDLRVALEARGFAIVRGVLPVPLLEQLRSATDRLSKYVEYARYGGRSQGASFPVEQMVAPVFGVLIGYPGAREILADLGFPHPTFTDGYVISKPPGSARHSWHYNWFAWSDLSCFAPSPPQIFFMYHLSDTQRGNGCLRVIPGSHYRENPLHHVLRPQVNRLSMKYDPDRFEFTDRPDEIDVPVQAGDLVIGDARLLNAAHGNVSQEWRNVITLWYQPSFERLAEAIQAQVAAKTTSLPPTWPPSVRNEVEALFPVYKGSEKPHSREYFRSRSEVEAEIEAKLAAEAEAAAADASGDTQGGE